MADQEQTVGIAAPSLPKGGGAIQSIGKGWALSERQGRRPWKYRCRLLRVGVTRRR